MECNMRLDLAFTKHSRIYLGLLNKSPLNFVSPTSIETVLTVKILRRSGQKNYTPHVNNEGSTFIIEGIP